MMSTWKRRSMSGSRTSAFLITITAAALGSSACGKPTPPAPPIPEVVVTRVAQRDVPIYSEAVGTTDGFVNAQVRPRVQGYLLRQTYADGAPVKTGDLLFEIDDREYRAALDEARGNLARQQAVLKKYELDVARYTPLAAKGAVSREELDDAIQGARAAKAQVDAAAAAIETARLNLGWTRVFAPIDGVAGIAPVQVGDLVTPSTLLTTISQLDPIKVTFPISEREYLQFAGRIQEHQRNGPGADEPEIEMILADGKPYPHSGRFHVANRQVEIGTGTIQLQALFPNPDGVLRPGLYAKIRAPIVVKRGALLVPQRAILETQGQYQAAVVGDGDKVGFRIVKPAEQVGDQWIIDEGLTAGERVITDGLQKVRDGMVVQPKDAAIVTATTAASEG
jgi:membrane fusion protein (multidrug efflux system)